MNCEFCGSWLEDNTHKHHILFNGDFGCEVIYCCEDCVLGLKVLLKEKYMGRDQINKELKELEIE